MHGWMFLNCSWKWSLSASGWWTALGWVVFALKGNLLIYFQRHLRLTDWPSFEFCFWLLLITLFLILFVHVQSYQCWHRHCCVVDWDGTGTTTDLWNLTLGLKQCGASVKNKKSGVLLKNILLSLLLLGLGRALNAWRSCATKWRLGETTELMAMV